MAKHKSPCISMMLNNPPKTILLVEDEILIALHQSRVLQSYGYTVIMVHSGEAAVEAIQTSPEIDLVLMDINLGAGMDGTQAAEIILGQYDLPLIFLSAHTEREIVEKIEGITSYGYVVKGTHETALDTSIKVAFCLFDARMREREKEIALQKSEEKYRLAMEATRDGVWDWDILTGKVDYSLGWAEILGEVRVPGRFGTWEERIHPDDLQNVLDTIHDHLEGTLSFWKMEHRLKTKAGDWKWVMGRGRVTSRDEDGRPLRMVGTMTDISDRKQAEVELRASESRLQAITAQMRDMVFVTDAQGTLIYISAAAEQIFGYEPAEMVGHFFTEFLPETEIPKAMDAFQSSVTAGIPSKNLQLQMKRKGGTTLIGELNGAPFQVGDVTGTIGVIRDITEQAETQTALRESETKLRTVLQLAPVGIGLVSEQTFREVNAQFCEITGYSRDELIGESVRKLYFTDDVYGWVVREKCRQIAERGTSTVETRFRRKDGKPVDVLLSYTPMDPNNPSAGFTSTVLDITDRVYAEKQLRFQAHLLNAVEQAVVVTDLDGRVVFWNPFAEQLYGWTAEEALGESAIELMGSESQRQHVEIMAHLQSGKSWSGEYWVRHRNGTPFYIRSTMTPFCNDAQVALTHIIELSSDITTHKRMDDSLREGEELLRKIAENYPNSYLSIIEKDLTVGFTAGQEFKKQGLDPAQFVGLPLEKVFGEKTAFVRAYYEKTFEGHACTFELFINDQYQLYRTVPLYGEDSSISRILVVVENITNRVQVEKNLRESEAHLRLSIEHMIEGYALHEAIFDADGHMIDYRFLEFNPAAQKISNIARADIVGHTALELYPHVVERGLLSRYANVMATGVPAHIEDFYYEGDNLDKAFDISCFRIDSRHFVCTFRDITERKRAEQALHTIEWLLTKGLSPEHRQTTSSYGDLTELNTHRLILDSVGSDTLQVMTSDYLDLLDTSTAIYEKNGDYAYGIFASGWCQFLDEASRRLCQTEDNRAALAGGRWLCHESCWTECSKVVIENGQSVDIECNGGLHIYALPIWAKGECIGAINFGYGDPPHGQAKMQEIAEKYHVSVESLRERADLYQTRPSYLIDIAKKRLRASAQLIGETVERKQAERALEKAFQEKHILLRELQHRAKNSFSMMRSLIGLMEDASQGDETKAALTELGARTIAMAELYDLLYATEAVTEMRLDAYFIRLTMALPRALNVHLAQDYQAVSVPVKVATSLGLILTELVTNALKYAFPDGRRGTITVSLRENEAGAVLAVADDGIGLSGGLETAAGDSLGFLIVHSLVQQIRGTLHVEMVGGTRCVVEFPIDRS